MFESSVEKTFVEGPFIIYMEKLDINYLVWWTFKIICSCFLRLWHIYSYGFKWRRRFWTFFNVGPVNILSKHMATLLLLKDTIQEVVIIPEWMNKVFLCGPITGTSPSILEVLHLRVDYFIRTKVESWYSLKKGNRLVLYTRVTSMINYLKMARNMGPQILMKEVCNYITGHTYCRGLCVKSLLTWPADLFFI